MKRVKKDENGMVLLLVLVIVVFLTSLVVEFSFSTFVQFRLTETFRDSTKAYYLAKGGVQAGMMALQNDTNSYDAYSEAWGQSWDNLPAADGWVSLKIEDLDGKLDVNRLVTDLGNINVQFKSRFLLFFENLDIADPEELTDALIDWIDPDSDPQPFGAEEDFYLREKGFSCRNGKLLTLDELLKIKGFTTEIVQKIKPHLTVMGNDKININTAGPEVLVSLSSEMANESAGYIVEYRNESPFETANDIKKVPGLPEKAYYAIKPSVDVKSHFFRINSSAMVNESQKRVQAIIDKDKNRLLAFKVE